MFILYVVTSMFIFKYLSIVLISYGVAGGQCVDIVLLLSLIYMVTLKNSYLFMVIAVYFGLLF